VDNLVESPVQIVDGATGAVDAAVVSAHAAEVALAHQAQLDAAREAGADASAVADIARAEADAHASDNMVKIARIEANARLAAAESALENVPPIDDYRMRLSALEAKLDALLAARESAPPTPAGPTIVIAGGGAIPKEAREPSRAEPPKVEEATLEDAADDASAVPDEAVKETEKEAEGAAADVTPPAPARRTRGLRLGNRR
jgi:hypothetical protein